MTTVGLDARDLTSDEAEINPASIYVSSVLATTVVLFLGIAIPSWFAFNTQWALGLGGMGALWGGPGFGCAVGSARLSLQRERRTTRKNFHS